MSKQIEFIVEWTIPSGKLAEFKKLAEAATRAVKENEPGSSRYCWYLSDDQQRCILTEGYADSEAMLLHFANVGSILVELFKIAAITRFEVLGTLSQEADEAVRGRGASRFAYVTGVSR